MRPSSRTRRKKPTKTGIRVLTVLLLCVSIGVAQDPKPKKGQPIPRTLAGVVTLSNDKPASGAAVLLENTKTKSIVSFRSQADGTYFFHELSPDVDYKVTARLDDQTSKTHTLSSFDSRKAAVINLKLEKSDKSDKTEKK